MELFDRTGINSIDFIPCLGFKIAQSHLREQAHDRITGEGSCFAGMRPERSGGELYNIFKNNKLNFDLKTGKARIDASPWKITNLILSS